MSSVGLEVVRGIPGMVLLLAMAILLKLSRQLCAPSRFAGLVATYTKMPAGAPLPRNTPDIPGHNQSASRIPSPTVSRHQDFQRESRRIRALIRATARPSLNDASQEANSSVWRILRRQNWYSIGYDLASGSRSLVVLSVSFNGNMPSPKCEPQPSSNAPQQQPQTGTVQRTARPPARTNLDVQHFDLGTRQSAAAHFGEQIIGNLRL